MSSKKILSQPQKQQIIPRKVILSVELTQPQKRKYHRIFMDLLDLSRKIFPNADIYLPKMNCPYSYLESEGRAICSDNQLRAMRAINRIIEEAIRMYLLMLKFFPSYHKIQNSVWNKMKRRIFGGRLRPQAN